MKQIPLTQEQFALVDDADYTWLNQWKWCAIKTQGGFYAIRNSPWITGKHYQIRMHRQILGLERGDKRQGDHRDHNTLDNRRSNIRICTPLQNTRNQKSRKNSTSKYKGVNWNKKCKKWMAQIRITGKIKHLGVFNNEETAAEAYVKVAKIYHKEFAYFNI